MRILITGAPGSGTTTLGRALASTLGATFTDADDYFWLPTEPPYKVEQARGLRLMSLLRALDNSSPSVVAGWVVGWGDELESSFSHVIHLWLPPKIRIARLIERESKRFGKPLEGFIEWAAQYDEGKLPGRSRAIHERWLAERNCPVIRIEGELGVSEAKAKAIAALSDNSKTEVRRAATPVSILGIGWCGLYAKDLLTLSKFYENVVGFKVLERDARCCIFDAGHNTHFEMWSSGYAATIRKTPNEQSVVVGFRVECIEPLVEQLRARGLESDTAINSYSGTRWIYYTDPEGNRFEFKDNNA